MFAGLCPAQTPNHPWQTGINEPAIILLHNLAFPKTATMAIGLSLIDRIKTNMALQTLAQRGTVIMEDKEDTRANTMAGMDNRCLNNEW